MGAAAHTAETVHPRGSWLRLWASFIVHQILASWGMIVAAPWTMVSIAVAGDFVGLHVHLPSMLWLLYGTPYFPAYVLLALGLGWLLSGWLPNPTMLWVWALPLFTLCIGVARYPHIPVPSHVTLIAVLGTYPWQRFVPAHPGGVGLAAALSHFFGWGRGLQPYDQVLVVVPFYTSAAYSLGALLARPATHTSPFFEGLRRVRVRRLALSVGFPWFLIEGIMLWEQGGSRMPFYRTAVGFEAFLGLLLIGGASMTLVFAVATSLMGPRFALTRFFISG